ncbi:MAG: YbaB/EbfC family nucleoid-associated protein [Phycisphaerales bacterium]|nr:YbaB/EbfC family nucleoid-associated protein [Phycisphaerales bacterium]
MFDGLKNLAGMASIMKDLPKMQARLEEVKKELASLRVESETGGGAVRVIATADLKIESIQIDPAVMGTLVDSNSPEDHRMAEELVAGAVNTAMERAKDVAKDHLAAAARDMGLPTPPAGLLGS